MLAPVDQVHVSIFTSDLGWMAIAGCERRLVELTFGHDSPEAAILGAGRIQPKAVVRDGQIVARQMWTLSLAFDHRVVDGAPAARFLQRIKQLVESPLLLLA